MNLDLYVNSGMLVMDVAGWRKENVLDEFIGYIRDHSSEIVWHDQDIINRADDSVVRAYDDKTLFIRKCVPAVSRSDSSERKRATVFWSASVANAMI